MYRARVIPCLLLKDEVLVKTVRFKAPSYVGDPLNAVRIYNELEVDELAFLDIAATIQGRDPSYEILSQIASECFMPLTYGGGIRKFDQAKIVLGIGFEKVVLGAAAVENPELITAIAKTYGSQSIIVAIDVKKKLFGGYQVMIRNGANGSGLCPKTFARRCEDLGAGEILLYSIDRDGTHRGYDITLIKEVSSSITIPVIACGGADSVADFGKAVFEGGASACAAGSMMVHYGPHRAVLINHPSAASIDGELIR